MVKKLQVLQSLPAPGPLPVQVPCLLTLPFSHPALVGSSPKPLAKHPRSVNPQHLHCCFISHGSTAVTQLCHGPLCAPASSRQYLPPTHTRLTGEGSQGQTALGAGGAPPHSLSTSRSKSLCAVPAWFSARQE